MEDEACGRNAMLMLNAKMINGKCIGVEESKTIDGPKVTSTRLKVSNVPSTMSANDLRDLFTKYGLILSVEITDTEAVVVSDAYADIRSALNDLNGYECGGQVLVIEPILNTSLSFTPKSRYTF